MEEIIIYTKAEKQVITQVIKNAILYEAGGYSNAFDDGDISTDELYDGICEDSLRAYGDDAVTKAEREGYYLLDDDMGTRLAVKFHGFDKDASELAVKKAIAEISAWEDEN